MKFKFRTRLEHDDLHTTAVGKTVSRSR